MAIQRSNLSPPACTSFNNLASSTTAVASSAAVTVGSSANITDHEVVVTASSPATFTGSAGTTVNVFAYASADGTNWANATGANENIDGTDKAIVWSANGNNARFLGTILMPMATAGTSTIYRSQPFSIASAFGGAMPSKYVIVLQNQTGAALPASGHSLAIQEIYYN